MKRRLAILVALLIVGGGVTAFVLHRAEERREKEEASRCAVGFGGAKAKHEGDEGEREEEEEREREEHEGEEKDKTAKAAGPSADLFAGPEPVEPCGGETPGGQPEPFGDLAKANSSIVSKSVAPGTAIKGGAYRSAIRQRASLPTVGEAWKPYGTPPLQSYRTEYDTTRGSTSEGLGDLSGRATAIARGDDGSLYAAISNGGVWKSTNNGDAWSSLGENLPTQVVSGVAKVGGRLLVLTGDNAFGGNTYAGLGAYYSDDEGKTWTHAAGIPDGLLSFRLAVDPSDTQKVYAATGGGLYRSTDGGASYVNVNLPTGDCAGQPVSAKNCFLANVVTDVTVQGKANAQTAGAKPGAVLAAVGWRAGTKANANGVPQSPGNGVYRSDDGSPGSFTNLDLAGNSTATTDPLTQARIGRIALGGATGDAQDHNVVYAIVQDAVKFNGGVSGLDVNDESGTTSAAQSDYLNAIYVSTDFGAHFTELEGSTTIDNDATSNSALAPPTCKAPAVISYCPGIQAWYNLWVAPDPTRQTAAGVPTRLAFGLEEIWSGTDAAGLDGTTPQKFGVVGRYYANCTLLPAANAALPVCPTAQNGELAPFTTHPDQHGALYVPDGSGGVTLFAANDGGIYKQHTSATEDFSNANWGQGKPQGRSGANNGLNTLQPYDASMAKDGTVYMGLQDNGEAKIEPNGDMYTIYGGDGFFSAVDPDNSKVAYEEYTAGDISVTKDGGRTWTDIAPALTSAQFATPFEMDRGDANHLMIGGRNVFETTSGPDTASGTWAQVYDLGTQKHPGEAGASAADDDPDNQLSAVDTQSFDAGSAAPTGPKTKDVSYTAGGATVPGLGDATGTGTFVPGSYDDHPFTIGSGDGDAAVHVDISWSNAAYDWDLYLLDSTGKVVASSATSTAQKESLSLPNPGAGTYTVRVVNYAAAGTFAAKVTFDQRTSGTVKTVGSYVGYCGFCDTITQGTPFANGIATNVGGDKPGKTGSTDGWHIAKATGLPARYVTSVRMDPQDSRTVYATLAGYGRRWAFPGAVGEDTSKVGKGHVFKSTDAGATFTDVSGDLPDAPANWTVLHNGHLVVGTDIGVFESCDNAGGGYARLGTGLPTTPVSTIRYKPGDPDTLVVATYGRGVYTYTFKDDTGKCPPPAGAPGTSSGTSTGPQACTAAAGFKSVKVTPRGHGLRFSVKRALTARYAVDVVQQSRGRRVLEKKTVKRFRNRKRSFTWKGAGKLKRGVYFTRVRIKQGSISDIRRNAFARSAGRFRKRPQFFATESCSILRSAKLNGPTFGGRFKRPLAIAFRLRGTGTVKLSYTQRGKTLLRRTITIRDVKYHRVRLPSRKAQRGDVRVKLVATVGTAKRTVRLVGRRL